MIIPEEEFRASNVRRHNGSKVGFHQSLKDFCSQAKFNFKATEGLLISLMLVFAITFLCFPGLSDDSYFSFLHGVRNEANWYNITSLMINSSTDTFGRFIGGLKGFDLNRKTIAILSIGRIVFFGTFLLIAFETRPYWLFGADWFKLLNYFVFAFLGGYLNNLCCIKAPQTVKGKEKAQVGSFIGITISIGVLIGCLFAVPLQEVIKLTPEGKK